MPTLEQVSKRIFSDPSWFVKTVVGTLLLFFPVPLVFALGYLYRVAQQGRLGMPLELPEFEDWRGLLIDGLRALVIVAGLTLVPILAGWAIALLLDLLLRGVPTYWVFAGLLYLPMVPALLLAAPLTAAGLYRYQRREDFQDAFRVPVLLKMIFATRGRFVIPTFAYIGFLVVLFPLIPYALFTGGLIVFYYYAATFHQLEQASRERASAATLIRR